MEDKRIKSKNLLRDKTCNNCRFRYRWPGTKWCFVVTNRPDKDTCKLWKKIQ